MRDILQSCYLRSKSCAQTIVCVTGNELFVFSLHAMQYPVIVWLGNILQG